MAEAWWIEEVRNAVAATLGDYAATAGAEEIASRLWDRMGSDDRRIALRLLAGVLESRRCHQETRS